MSYDLLPKEAAADYLRDLLKDYPFAEDGGRSLAVQVAAMLTGFARLLLPPMSQVPFFIWTANGVAAGKSVLAMMVDIAVRGRAALLALPDDEKELGQLLGSMVMAGNRSLLFDNAKRKIEGAALEALATSSYLTGRRLGGNKTFEMENNLMVMITANDVEVSTDMARRSLFVQLELKEADPQGRKFEKLINPEYLARLDVRFSILSALWSLIVAWDQAGRPAGSGSLASFEVWSRTIGGIVEYAGFGDPVRRLDSDDFGDPDSNDMMALVSAMAEGVYKDGVPYPFREGVTFRQLVEVCRDRHLFEEIIRGKVDTETREYELYPKAKTDLGKLFKNRCRVYSLGGELGTVKFERTGKKDNRLWRIC
jgi:hypothetical protein